jgi:hypothetical protein
MAGRGRGYGGYNRGQRDELPQSEWPPREEILEALVFQASKVYGTDRAAPTLVITMPPEAPAGEEYDHLRDAAARGIKLLKGDLNDGPGDARGRFQRLAEAATVGLLSAYKRPPLVRISDRFEICNYSTQNPSTNVRDPTSKGRDNVKPFVIGPNRRPIHLVGSSPTIRDSICTGQKGFKQPLVIAVKHMQDCACPSLYESNNLPYCTFLTTCIPRNLAPIIENSRYSANAVALFTKPAVMVNPSICYGDEVSTSGLVKPKMLVRQPLSSIARTQLRRYTQKYSSVELDEDIDLMDGLYAYVKYGDWRNYTENLDLPEAEFPREDEVEGWPRFEPLSRQLASPDVDNRCEQDILSLEEILCNSISVQAFFGHSRCRLCGEYVLMEGIKSLIQHFGMRHTRLFISSFSCVGCIKIVVVDVQEFCEHYQEVHTMTECLTTVLDTTDVAHRTMWCMALRAWFSAVHALPIKPEDCIQAEEERNFTGPLGGYINGTSEKHKRALARTIRQYRDMEIPRAEVHRRQAWAAAKEKRMEQERLEREEEERARRELEREKELRALRKAREEAELEAARKKREELRSRKGPQPTPEEEMKIKKSWIDQCEEERKKRLLEARHVPSSAGQILLSGSEDEKTSEESDSSDEPEKPKKSKKKTKEPSPRFSEEEEEEKSEDWKKVSKKRKKKSASKSPKAKCGEDKTLPKGVNRGDSACSAEATGDDASEAGPSRGRRGSERPGPSTELQDEFADEDDSVNRQEANTRLVESRKQPNEDEARRLLDEEDEDVQMVED